MNTLPYLLLGISIFSAACVSTKKEPDSMEEPGDRTLATWDQVPSDWKQEILNSPKKDFYDPRRLVTQKTLTGSNLSDISIPAVYSDYDGDGIDNLTEYRNGTDPTDFFNGERADIAIKYGDAQIAKKNVYLNKLLQVVVTDHKGEPVANVPVRFTALRSRISSVKSRKNLTNQILERTDKHGCALVFCFTPNIIGNSYVDASLPDGKKVNFSVQTAKVVEKRRNLPIRAFTKKNNPDGTTTYTWISDAEPGEWFNLEEKTSGGEWEVFYQTTYGSAELPYVPGKNNYRLTIPRDPLSETE